ncbi:hypothetical protein HY479_01655 [Candidatus Uhrbacteria bacterium]|nr:hypothetical protein [Candidatus Uhrbacteria bacterium]
MTFDRRFLLPAVLAALSVAMGAYLLVQFRKTSAPGPITSAQPTEPEPPKETNRAFVTVGAYENRARRGGAWTVDITAPTWSKCIADVYDPANAIRMFDDPKRAEAAVLSPGKHRWTWNVPSDAVTGAWTIRLLCGTFDNLATADVAVSVE